MVQGKPKQTKHPGGRKGESANTYISIEKPNGGCWLAWQRLKKVEESLLLMLYEIQVEAERACVREGGRGWERVGEGERKSRRHTQTHT